MILICIMEIKGSASSGGFPGGTSGEERACQRRRCKRRGFDPWVGKIPWRGAWQPALVFLPGESHGQRSPWGAKSQSPLSRHKHHHTKMDI